MDRGYPGGGQRCAGKRHERGWAAQPRAAALAVVARRNDVGNVCSRHATKPRASAPLGTDVSLVWSRIGDKVDERYHDVARRHGIGQPGTTLELYDSGDLRANRANARKAATRRAPGGAARLSASF